MRRRYGLRCHHGSGRGDHLAGQTPAGAPHEAQPTPTGAPARRAHARRPGMGDSPRPPIHQPGPTPGCGYDGQAEPADRTSRRRSGISIGRGSSTFPPRPVLPVGRPRLGARPSSGVRLRYGRLAPVGAARRGAAPLLLVSSSYRYRCAVLATRPSRQLHSALVAQPRRQRCAASGRRRVSSSCCATRIVDARTCSCGVPGCHMPTSPYRELPVARRFRGRGSAARASLQVAARRLVLIAPLADRRPLPGVRGVLV